MNTAPASLSFLFIASLTVVGCDDTSTEPSTTDDLQLRSNVKTDPERGAWINNGLADPQVSGIDPAFALSSSEGLAEDLALLNDANRYDTTQYLVECALPAGQTIDKVVDGQLLSFDGMLGLAPEWENGVCDEDCQEWVSACLLARTNASGETVDIWMQADHPAIGMESSALHPTYEASFFGNLFEADDSRNFCQGLVVGPALAQLEGRTCSNVVGESCGFTQYTLCEVEERCQFASALPSVLGAFVGPTAIGCTADGDDHAYHTITTYVSPI